MLEACLITHCAPTLANLKTASLFRCPCPGPGELEAWRTALNHKGIELTVLRCDGTHALIYVYRPARLRAELLEKCPALRDVVVVPAAGVSTVYASRGGIVIAF